MVLIYSIDYAFFVNFEYAFELLLLNTNLHEISISNFVSVIIDFTILFFLSNQH